jgi:hypothetical protein
LLRLRLLRKVNNKRVFNTIYIDEKHEKNYSVEGAAPAFAMEVKRLPIHDAIKFILSKF